MQENQPDAGMMGQSLAIVDLDGTLLEDRERHYRCYRDIVESLGGVPTSLDTYIALKRTRKSMEQILSLSRMEMLAARFSEMFIGRIESKKYLAYERLRPDAIRFMDEIGKMGMKLMLATMRNNKENLRWQLRKLGICSYFGDRILCGAKREITKDSLVPWTIRCVIGDTEDDEAMARRLDTTFFGVLSGMREKSFLHADYYVESLREIPPILWDHVEAR